MINKNDNLSIVKQCEMLDISRSTAYYEPVPEYSTEDYKIMEKIDKIFTERPFYGYRRIYHELREGGYNIGRDRVLKLMKKMGIKPIYPKPRTTIFKRENRVYPYLLSELEIKKPNQVWSSDITYIPLKHGFCYMVAIIDYYSRKILSYRISNTMDVNFCLEVLEEALRTHGTPEIFNTDQGSQFTSHVFTKILLDKGILISMDSKGRALDNIFIERFWRSLKYEDIYIKKYETMKEVKKGIKKYIEFYNFKRMHSSLGYKTPGKVYNDSKIIMISTIGDMVVA